MKSGWAIKKLGEVCELIGGGTPSIHESSYYGGNIPWATVRDMNCRVIEKTERTITRKGLENSASNVIPAGNVIISTHVGLGKVCFVAQDTAINQDLKGVIPFADNIQKTFLYYWFLSIADYLEKSGTGSTVRGVKLDFVKSLELPIPPLHEQKRIVAKIDAAFEKIDKLKANAERNLANAKELFQSALDEAMRPKKGWMEKRLGEVYNFIDYRGKTPNKINEGVPLVTARNIRMGYLDYAVRDFISQTEYKTRQSRGIARKGDILFTTEAPLGFVALADLEEFSTGQRVITFQQYKGSEQHLLNEFYFYYFQANGFQGEIRKQATGATAQGIKASRLREIPVAVVPYTEQQSIVKRLDILAEKTKSLEQHYTRQIADCSEMRQSVLREAFEGRL